MPRSTTSTTHKKRHGHHQKRTPHFLRVYQPFLPLLIVLVAVFTLAKTLPAHHQTVQTTPSTRPVPAVLAYATNINSNAMLAATNQRRADANVGNLALNSKLTAAAQAKANDMATRNYWSHNTPEGNPPWTFISNAGYSYDKAGENLACGFDNSVDVITGWYNSPAHRENLLLPDYKDVGFGIANADNYNCGDIAAGQQTIVVAMYGTPYNAAATAPTTQTAPKDTTATKPATVIAPVQANSSDKPITSHNVILTVTDSAGKPVNGIKTTIHSVEQTGYTNSQGVVQFNNIASGNHTVTLEINGAESNTPISLSDTIQDYKLTIIKPALAANMIGTGSSSSVQPKSIIRLDLLTKGYTPWILTALIVLCIVGGLYVFVKHSIAAHKFIVKGERYILTHKFIDFIVVILIISLYFLTRSVAAVL